MTASLAYSATAVSKLTGAQLTELNTAPAKGIGRLAPGTTRTANRQDVRTQVRTRLIRNALKRIEPGATVRV